MSVFVREIAKSFNIPKYPVRLRMRKVSAGNWKPPTQNRIQKSRVIPLYNGKPSKKRRQEFEATTIVGDKRG